MVETVINATWAAASVFVIWIGLARRFVVRRMRQRDAHLLQNYVDAIQPE